MFSPPFQAQKHPPCNSKRSNLSKLIQSLPFEGISNASAFTEVAIETSIPLQLTADSGLLTLPQFCWFSMGKWIFHRALDYYLASLIISSLTATNLLCEPAGLENNPSRLKERGLSLR